MKAPTHLNALRAFEASARHQSFSLAARELNVTAAAVGQLVRSLEDWLGTPLFLRATSGRKRLVPTAVALKALPEIRAGFDQLVLGMERLREGSASGALTVTASPSFTAKWLLPRIDRFQALCPDMTVRLDINHHFPDFIAQGIDAGVRYGVGHWPGLAADKLMDEEVYPVCSPAWLGDYQGECTLDRLAQATLIHDLSMDGDPKFPTWKLWLESVGVTDFRPAHSLQINNSAAVLQAAIEGRGVALARSVMARDDLESGRLLRLFPDVCFTSPMSYYVVYRPECTGLPRLAVFVDWLQAEAAVFEQRLAC
ncbi:MAG: LysR substrate-binding domain-containing protein [Castellaniella sp.]